MMIGKDIVAPDDWLAARKALLREEREMTKLRDRIREARRALPMTRVERDYVFSSVDGDVHLADLFEGRSQLLIQHFMFGPDWDQGCLGCSFEADHLDAAFQHLRHNDIALVAIARAPADRLDAYRSRMGWRFPFLSSADSAFNFDFNVSFRRSDIEAGTATYNYRANTSDIEDLPGLSAFDRDADGDIFHTYSSFARGNEEVLSAYMLLDVAPLDRNESTPMSWVKRHDEYPMVRGG